MKREAEELLRTDLQSAVDCVNRAVTAAITQNQFDALVDFCFNVGCGAFEKSTLLRKVNAADFAGAATQFALWVHAGGEVVAGLVRRRKLEAEMFARTLCRERKRFDFRALLFAFLRKIRTGPAALARTRRPASGRLARA